MTGHALGVRRLRFRGGVANPLAARGRVEMALATGASASRLGSEAILCVRRLAIALPRLDHLSGALEAETAGAARPSRGAVPANANAVLFADRAELLACLARDWCAGDATARWWWPVLFSRVDFAAIVRRAWLEDARPVPAALARLEAAGLAPKFLAKLSPANVATLWRNIVNTFHLPDLDAAWSAIDLPAAAPAAMRRSREAAPWAPWITPDFSLTLEAARILITAILLERAPAKVRSVSFAREVRAWIQPPETRPAARLFAEKIIPPVEHISKRESPQSVPRPIAPRSIPGLARPTAEPTATTNLWKAEWSVDQTPRPPAHREERSPNSRRHEDPSRATRSENGGLTTSVAAATDETIVLPAAALPDRIATEWGGSLYLVNIAIALRLYGDFTTPAQPGLALPLWDFLALVGERMIGEEFAEDPLPGLFARLSGRGEGERPGADFETPSGEPFPTWLDRICQDVQARVAASLGLDDDCDLRALVLNHPAKIETNSERLDAYFSLAKHPVELRVAGLDRDPGWVPAGGRSLYFHYD